MPKTDTRLHQWGEYKLPLKVTFQLICVHQLKTSWACLKSSSVFILKWVMTSLLNSQLQKPFFICAWQIDIYCTWCCQCSWSSSIYCTWCCQCSWSLQVSLSVMCQSHLVRLRHISFLHTANQEQFIFWTDAKNSFFSIQGNNISMRNQQVDGWVGTMICQT